MTNPFELSLHIKKDKRTNGHTDGRTDTLTDRKVDYYIDPAVSIQGHNKKVSNRKDRQ